MKPPSPYRRATTGELEEVVEETPAVEEAPIDITEPRECIYRRFEDHPGPCPRCGGPLQQSSQTYMVATRRGRKITDSFMVGSNFGWFCTRCPTVVINPDDVAEMLQHSLPRWDVGHEFAMVGIVDLDAVPEEKNHLPLGDDDNPVTLVEFTNVSDQTTPRRPARKSKPTRRKRARPAQRKLKKKKKRRRRR